jgi:hypothetical protein
MSSIATTVEFISYQDEVLRQIIEEQQPILEQLAIQAAERVQAKIIENGQVWTGFMLESVYPFWPGGSEYDVAVSAAMAQNIDPDTGKQVNHDGMIDAPAESSNDLEAGVGVAATYAIYNELRNSFLEAAMTEVSLDDAVSSSS